MVFFNYTTMQMTAKIVYYGPGLGGKTTNLKHIYAETSSDLRGEMVSLETDTDRTLFFDLLPIDIGVVGGFETRIQLYTVPGQVFYNTTRKLVLKGVDGVVFVADSQRAMKQANADSLKNLKANLAEIGIDIDEIPLVLQYNKCDLQDICSREELDAVLNLRQWPVARSSAVNGDGVFETFTEISKLTLRALRDKLRGEDSTAAAPEEAPKLTASEPDEPAAEPPLSAAAPGPQTAPDLSAGAAPEHPSNALLAGQQVIEEPAEEADEIEAEEPITEKARSAASEEDDEALEEFDLDDFDAAPASEIAVAKPPDPLALGEGSPLATQTLVLPSTLTEEASQQLQKEAAEPTSNGHVSLEREIALHLPRGVLRRARKVAVSFYLEDADDNVVGGVQRSYEIESQELSDLLLSLLVEVSGRDEAS